VHQVGFIYKTKVVRICIIYRKLIVCYSRVRCDEWWR